MSSSSESDDEVQYRERLAQAEAASMAFDATEMTFDEDMRTAVITSRLGDMFAIHEVLRIVRENPDVDDMDQLVDLVLQSLTCAHVSDEWLLRTSGNIMSPSCP